MDEALRQHYLSAMGIPVWYSRCRLPGAKPSPDWDFSGFAASQDEAALEGRPAERARRGLEQARQAMAPQETKRPQPQHPPLKTLAPATETQAPVAGPSSQLEGAQARNIPAAPGSHETADAVPAELSGVETGEVPHFHVRVYRLPGSFGICLAHPEIEAHREQILLSNIVAGCWGVGAAAEPLFEFVWPVFANERLRGQDKTAANATLRQAFLDYEVAGAPLILFGMSSVWPQSHPGSTLSSQELGLPSGSRALCTWRLGDGLLDPQRKKEIWLHLRGFLKTG